MLEILSNGFKQARDHLKGVSTLTEENLKESIAAVRQSLLDADVEYGVVKAFLQRVQDGALGKSVNLKAGSGEQKLKVRPGDHFVEICRQELESLMGPVNTQLNLPSSRPAVIMMVGLQGSGKTTTTGKIARFLQKSGRKPMLVAADIYRPAAIDQLKVLGQRLGAPVFSLPGANPVEICRQAVAAAAREGADVLMLDTAGRLAIDEPLMKELQDIRASTHPDNILFVCDAMMGQDAVATAKAFNDRLSIDGVVITKLDGDARGGAALSIKEVTGKPIKFLGMGEDLERLEEFRPEGLASRILGMGDIVGLMHDFDRVAQGDREAEAMKMLKGQFNFRDFYEQLSTIQKMGSLKDIFGKLPLGNIPGFDAKNVNLDDRELVKIKAMIDSMTVQERVDPNCFNDSRIKRVARGAGRQSKEVADLIKRFKQMRQMMGMLGQGMGLLGKIPGGKALGQLNQLRNMAKQAGMGGGGLPGMPGGLPGLGGGMPGFGAMGDFFSGGATESAPRQVDRDKLRKMRKAAKAARKKNRR
jgi:signal recognition particle subunit SRP54